MGTKGKQLFSIQSLSKKRTGSYLSLVINMQTINIYDLMCLYCYLELFIFFVQSVAFYRLTMFYQSYMVKG